MASGNTTRMESSQVITDKLHLACAVFEAGSINPWICTYPEVFSVSMCRGVCYLGAYSESTEHILIRDRFGIKFLEDAPYIVHACGLDPNMATAEDMDRWNARLKCLYCNSWRIMSWRDAVHLPVC